MAKRRMFSLEIVDTDAFLDMPTSSQNLYFHLGMRADDDGFVASPKRIIKVIGSSEDDLRILVEKKFIIAFDTGIVVIKHWKINNYLRPDRYKETNYLDEKSQLITKENGAYKFVGRSFGIPSVNQNVYNLDTQDRLGKVSIDKDSIGKVSIGKDKENKEINKENNARARENTQISNYRNEKLDKFSEVANYNWLDKHKR